VSKTRRFWIAVALFVLVPGVVQFFLAINNPSPPVTYTPVDTPSSTPAEPSCSDLRAEKVRLEELRDSESKETLNEINNRQRDSLLSRLKQLREESNLSAEEWSNIKSLVARAASDEPPIFGLDPEFVTVSKSIDRLIKSGKIRPYLDEDVIDLGQALANKPNEDFELVLANKECFDEFEISMAESISKVSVESAWEKKKSANDFVDVLTYKNR
jgi:hypothetical protein